MASTQVGSVQETEAIPDLSVSEAAAQERSHSVSPRRVPTNELLEKGLQRFVRKEKETPLPSHNPEQFPQISNARYKLTRLNENKKNADPSGKSKIEEEIKKFETALNQANDAKSLSPDELKKITSKHAISSKDSPFLSGTPALTTGLNSQEYYANASNKRGKEANFTILHTNRTVSNPMNSREHELLLPDAEQRREIVGKFTQHPDGQKTYVDTSGDEPTTTTGEDAQAKFHAVAGKLSTQR
ncbi:hypothetical protein JOE11_005349 [Robbsia andropogonis]|uniref:hypothetical protein n=1 Tax=Robbsia andropogonis TaxID=28092 RepID=UPI003D2062D6